MNSTTDMASLTRKHVVLRGKQIVCLGRLAQEFRERLFDIPLLAGGLLPNGLVLSHRLLVRGSPYVGVGIRHGWKVARYIMRVGGFAARLEQIKLALLRLLWRQGNGRVLFTPHIGIQATDGNPHVDQRQANIAHGGHGATTQLAKVVRRVANLYNN